MTTFDSTYIREARSMIGLGMRILWVAALAATLAAGAARPTLAAEHADPGQNWRATSSTDATSLMAQA